MGKPLTCDWRSTIGDRCWSPMPRAALPSMGQFAHDSPDQNQAGRGSAWSNSLFEDNAEFGLGMRVCHRQTARICKELLRELSDELDPNMVSAILQADESDGRASMSNASEFPNSAIHYQKRQDPRAKQLMDVAENLCRKSVWIVGGDGWAYDIDMAGLIMFSPRGRTSTFWCWTPEVYSNTGGKHRKPPQRCSPKFSAGGKASTN